MGFWKLLRCQETARMAKFSGFRISPKWPFLNQKWPSGNPGGTSRGVRAHPGQFWATSFFDESFTFSNFVRT